MQVVLGYCQTSSHAVAIAPSLTNSLQSYLHNSSVENLLTPQNTNSIVFFSSSTMLISWQLGACTISAPTTTMFVPSSAKKSKRNLPVRYLGKLFSICLTSVCVFVFSSAAEQRQQMSCKLSKFAPLYVFLFLSLDFQDSGFQRINYGRWP